MTSKFSGRCLCGSVNFECSAEPVFQACCHCDDCRRSSGGIYGSYAFVPTEALKVAGIVHSYKHQGGSGSTMTKDFCPTCGSPMFGSNSSKPDRRGIRVGVIDDANWFKPQAYVFASKKLTNTPLDPEVKSFDMMPG